LAMALDEPKETDEVKAVDGFTYVIDKEFLEKAQPVKVDFIDYGFRLTSSIKIDSGCSGCGSGSCEV
jgi:iron-sulfur cluster assembly protein